MVSDWSVHAMWYLGAQRQIVIAVTSLSLEPWAAFLLFLHAISRGYLYPFPEVLILILCRANCSPFPGAEAVISHEVHFYCSETHHGNPPGSEGPNHWVRPISPFCRCWKWSSITPFQGVVRVKIKSLANEYFINKKRLNLKMKHLDDPLPIIWFLDVVENTSLPPFVYHL